jgi:hypothetical protein
MATVTIQISSLTHLLKCHCFCTLTGGIPHMKVCFFLPSICTSHFIPSVNINAILINELIPFAVVIYKYPSLIQPLYVMQRVKGYLLK